MKKQRKKTKNYFFHDFVKITAAIPGLLWFRMKKVFVSKEAKKKIKKGALIISNHSGDIDPMVLMVCIWYRRHHFIATTELFNTKLKRFIFENFRCIEIDKQNVSMDTFREIVSYLKKDKIVSMFPEGYLTRNEEVQKFKSGVVLMSVTANKPIIPIYIKKRKSVWNRQCVVIGEPINPTEICGKTPSLKEMENIAEILRQKEETLKEIADKL